MKPIKLHLKNFGSHVDSIINFDDNSLIGVTGYWENDLGKSNGSGKSTFVDAILYSLYGKSRASGSGDNVDKLVRDGQDKMFVEFEFEHNGQKIKVKKQTHIKGKTVDNKFYVWVNGELMAEKQTEGKKMIAQLFNVDYDVFLATSFFAQGEAGKFMNASSTEKKEYLRKIDDLSIWEDAEKKAKTDLRAIKADVEKINGKLEIYGAAGSTENKIEEANRNITKNKIALNDCKRSIEELEDNQAKYLKHKETLIKLEMLSSQLKPLIGFNQEKIDEKITEITKITSKPTQSVLDFNYSAYEKNSSKLNALSAELATKSHQLDTWLSYDYAQKAQYEKQLSQIKTGGEYDETASHRLDKLNSELAEAGSKFDNYNGNLFTIGKLNKRLNHIESIYNCIECGGPISDSSKAKQIAEIKLDILDLSAGKDQGRIVDALLKDKEDLMEIVANNEALEMKIDLMEKIVKIKPAPYTNEQISEIAKVVYDLNNQLLAEKVKKDTFEKNKKNIESDRNSIREMEREIKSIQENMNKRYEIENAIDELMKVNSVQYQDLSKHIRKENQNLSSINSNIALGEKEIKDLKRVLSSIDELNNSRQEKLNSVSVYEDVIVGFGKNGIPHLIIQNTLQSIEGMVNDLLDEIGNNMSINFITQRENKTGKTAEVIEVMVNYNGKERDYNLLSGGEKSIVNFCVRLAISMYISNQSQNAIETVILDEVFGEVDESGRGKVFSMLNILKDKFNKIIVISHSSMKDIFPSLIQFKRNEEGTYVGTTTV